MHTKLLQISQSSRQFNSLGKNLQIKKEIYMMMRSAGTVFVLLIKGSKLSSSGGTPS
jgi:hypothetical protein